MVMARGNGVDRWNKGRNISWRNGSLYAERAKAGLRHAVVCPNVTGRTKKRLAERKQARAGSLALVDYLIATSGANLYPSDVWFADRCHDVFLRCYLCFVLLRFLLYAFVEATALRSIVLRYAGAPIAIRVFLFSLFVYLEMSFFPSIFCTIAAFSLNGEYIVRSFHPHGVFLPCDHGLDF